MLSISKATIYSVALVAALICWPDARGVLGDTIRLTNGNTIEGKVDNSRNPKVETHTRVTFTNGGWMLIKNEDIEEITQNSKDAFEQAESRRAEDEGVPEE